MRIGIVVPAHDVAPFIGAAIASVIAQSHADWAMCIVDDGSTDDTASIAEDFADPRIRVLRQANQGVAAARNRGVAEIAAEAILFLDGDDMLAPDALARLAAGLTGPAIAAYGAYAYVAEDAVAPGTAVLERRVVPGRDGDLLRRLLRRNLFANGGHVLIRRDALPSGGFHPGLSYGEDWAFWVRLALGGLFAAVPGREPVLYVRRRAGSAYMRLASQPDAFLPVMAVIFEDPELRARLGPVALTFARARAAAENDWIVGRELLRHRQYRDGLRRLRASVAALPSVKRMGLLGLAHLAPLMPMGPFAPYRK